MQKFGTTDRRSGPSVISIIAALTCFLPSSAGVAQNSETSGENAKRPLIVYRLDPITNTRVLPNSFPNIPGEEGGELSLAGCRGEYESESLAIYARQELKNLQLEISDLRCANQVLPKSSFEPFVVKCWYQAGRDVMFHDGVKRFVPELLLKDDALVRVDTQNETNHVRSTEESGGTGYLPASGKDPKELEQLRPVDAATLQPLTIPGETVKQFWLTLHIPDNAVGGTYTGTVRLSASGIKTVEVPISVTVHDFELAYPRMVYSIYYPGKLSAEPTEGTIAAHYKSEEQMRV